jgi:hypothetical protein
VIWTTGYVYWQIRISAAITELKEGPGKYENQLFYANPDLLEIGSRGIGVLLDEYEDALAQRATRTWPSPSLRPGDALRRGATDRGSLHRLYQRTPDR